MTTLSALTPSFPVAQAPVIAVPTAVPASAVAAAGVGAAILVFIVIFSVVWIILFSFRPSFCRVILKGEAAPAPDAPADPARCFVASLIISLLIVIIIWMFKACR